MTDAFHLAVAQPEHIADIAGILYDAFAGVHGGHGFPLDIPTPRVAALIADRLVRGSGVAGLPDSYGVVALLDGKVVGSNFTQICDAVSGVGPISVDPRCQARGVGRALMKHIVDWSLANHGPMVRLMQDGFNMSSLSLYTALGFRFVDAAVLMEIPPAKQFDPSVRPLTPADVSAADELCRRVFKVSRKNEVAIAIEFGGQSGPVPHGRFVDGEMAAYLVPGLMGHGIGRSPGDLLTTAMQAARAIPPEARKCFVPPRLDSFFRQALELRFRSVKLMSMMAIGPFEEPMGPESCMVWGPSVAY